MKKDDNRRLPQHDHHSSTDPDKTDKLIQRAEQVEKLAKGVVFGNIDDTVARPSDPPPATMKVEMASLAPSQRFGSAISDRTIWLTFEFGGESHQAQKIEIGDSLVLGRGSKNPENSPDIDLTPYGATEHGVSRRHAQITRHDNTLRLMDLSSTNGTYLNGELLFSGQPRLLREGDEIQLGTLVVGLYFDRADEHFSE